jgi:PAS domain S-box-containing protein
MVGGTLAFFTLFSSAQAGLVVAGVLRMPIIVSFPFLAVLLAMSWELSLDVRRAVQLGRELRESEQRMALAAEAANLGVWVRDLARDEIWASDRWRVLFGFTTTEQLDLDKFLQRLHPDDREIFRQSVAKATSGDGRYEAEFRVALPDGRIRWIISRGRVEFGRGGKPVRVRGISGDITDRKRAEEANRNVQELMAAVFNSVPGLLYLYTEDGRLVKWNKQHELMTGYTAAELLDFRIQDWFDEENRLKLAQEFPKIFSEGYTQVEMSLILKNKQKMPIFATGSKLMLDGKPHMVGIAMDITARKKAEAELRQSEERFHAVVEQASDGFELLDLDGRYLEVNAATLRQLGYTREEVLRLTIFDVDPLLDRDRFIKESPTITGTKPLRLETVHRRKDGSTFPVEVTVSTIQIGSRRCLFALVRDITERKQTEAEVLRQRAELAHVSRVSVMGELSASMAHELNQPLTAILSNTQAAQRFLAADKLDRAEFDEILKDIVHDTTRARDVIRHLRALVKKSEREFVRVDVNEIISQVVAFLHGDIVGRNVIVIQELAPELPLVLGDRTQLQQVLLNLLLNAFDAVSGKRVPDRRVTVLTAMASPEMVRVAVRDGGVGIPPGKFDEIFQPFFTTKTEGLGMGLSVSRSIIEGHGGRLTAENNAGPGATLSFTCRGASKAGGVV